MASQLIGKTGLFLPLSCAKLRQEGCEADAFYGWVDEKTESIFVAGFCPQEDSQKIIEELNSTLSAYSNKELAIPALTTLDKRQIKEARQRASGAIYYQNPVGLGLDGFIPQMQLSLLNFLQGTKPDYPNFTILQAYIHLVSMLRVLVLPLYKLSPSWSLLVTHIVHRWEILVGPAFQANCRTAHSRKVLSTHQSVTASIKLKSQFQAIIFDLILGMIAGLLLFRYASIIVEPLTAHLKEYCFGFFERHIGWLMGYPAGLKLNSNLNRFLGQLHLWLLSLWEWPLALTYSKLIPILLYLLALLACTMGFTAALCLTTDLLALTMLPLHVSYRIVSRLYGWEVTIIGSLFHLFRGKKWNVLHNRTDSASYDLDQLLLGTVIFSALIFLFPTVAVYYGLFLFVKVKWLLLRMVLEMTVQVLDEFPYAGVQRRSSLLAGIKLEICREDKGSRLIIGYRHETMANVLSPFFRRLTVTAQNYCSWQNVFNSFSGRMLYTL